VEIVVGSIQISVLLLPFFCLDFMIMEGFASGFKIDGGINIENEDFRVTFAGVSCDSRKNIVSHGFECCYDWSAVMNMILEATKNYDDAIVQIEEGVEMRLRNWLTTFQGWGLLSSILPTERHRYFILGLAYTSANWDESSGGPYSAEKIFDTVKFVYDHSPGKEIWNLVPTLWGSLEDNYDDALNGNQIEIDLKNADRMKSFTIWFNAKWLLEVKFLIEKKRNNNNLLDLAAEAVAFQVSNREDLTALEIPPTLHSNLMGKFGDVLWVRGHQMTLLENEEVETDSSLTGNYLEAEEDIESEEDVHCSVDVSLDGELECSVDESSISKSDTKEVNLCDRNPLDELQEESNDFLPDDSIFHTLWGALIMLVLVVAYISY